MILKQRVRNNHDRIALSVVELSVEYRSLVFCYWRIGKLGFQICWQC